MVSPYLPMLFMGEEYSEQNPFLYFVSHTDEDLIKAVQKGRKDEFKAFHAQGEAPDPQSPQTFQQSKLNWGSLSNQQQKNMLQYYKELIKLRNTLPALHNLNRENLSVTFNAQQQTLQLQRWEGDNKVYCLMNFSKQQQPFELSAESLTIALNSSQNIDRSDNLLQPESIIIYTNQYV